MKGKQIYLGDGVYVTFIGNGLELLNDESKIELNEKVFRELLQCYADENKLIIQVTKL